MTKEVVPCEHAQEPPEVALLWLGPLWLHQWRVAVQRLSWDDRVDAIGLVWSIESIYPSTRVLVEYLFDLNARKRPNVRHRVKRSVSTDVKAKCVADVPDYAKKMAGVVIKQN